MFPPGSSHRNPTLAAASINGRRRQDARAATPPHRHAKSIDAAQQTDAELVAAALASNEAAWRALLRRYQTPLREAARDMARSTSTDVDAEDIVGDLWLSLIEDDKRRLRSFDSSRGAAFLSWATIRLVQLVYQREERRSAEPTMLPIRAAKGVCDPRWDLGSRTLLNVEDVARRWGLDRKTVYAMVERGELASRRCGRLLRIPRKVVESFESQASVVPGGKNPCR